MLDHAPAPGLVCGDFNEPPGGGVQQLMEARGFVDLAPRFGFGAADTHTSKRSRCVDYIWAQAALVPRVKSFRLAEPAELALDGGRYLSDHLPLVVTLE